MSVSHLAARKPLTIRRGPGVQRVISPEGDAYWLAWVPTRFDPDGPQLFDSREAAWIYVELMLTLWYDEVVGDWGPWCADVALADARTVI